MRNNNLYTMLLVVLVATVGLTAASRADGPTDVGVARISDQWQTASTPVASSYCPTGDCQCESVGHGSHWHHSGRFRNTSRSTRHHQRAVSADDGWTRPVTNPIRRNPVEYRRYWPSKWWGQPGSALSARRPAFPQVHMPTDTTQLGYYYQKAPQWRPNPAMVPPMPWPSAWHRREAPNLHAGEYGIPSGTVIEPAKPTPAAGPHAIPPVPSAPPTPQAGTRQNRIPPQSVQARYWSGETIRN